MRTLDRILQDERASLLQDYGMTEDDVCEGPNGLEYIKVYSEGEVGDDGYVECNIIKVYLPMI